MNKKTIFLITGITLVLLTMSLPALGGPNRDGQMYRTKYIEVGDIKSRNQENGIKHGLIWYSIKIAVRNRTRQPFTVNIKLQAVDRNGYELKENNFYDVYVDKSSVTRVSDRTVMDAQAYKNISKWKVKKISYKRR